MVKPIAIAAVLAFSCVAGQCSGMSEPNRPAAIGSTPAAAPAPAKADANSVRFVLDKLRDQVANLKSYQCKIDYAYNQPVFQSTERRKGTLQYARMDGRSYLYIDFTTLQYDQSPEQKKREQYLFDGVWLTYIDHDTRSVQRRQVAEPNAPVDAFALASKRVPIMGFARVEDLEKQFDIERAPLPTDAPVYKLHMKVKPDSVYKDDYTTMDVEISKKAGLPSKIQAVTPDKDVYEITLVDPKINESIPKKTFEINAPKDYSVETVPLEKGRPVQGQP
jgi:outer membrane lipoprotein-sorting protein